MNSKELKEINARLKAWREARNISIESQRQGLVINLLEEFVELNRAKNEYEKIDALCDMCVFILNAYKIDSIIAYPLRDFTFNQRFLSLIQAMEMCKGNKKLIIRKLLSLIQFEFKDYDLYSCLNETLKEIESRQGKYDSVAKKWIKDSNAKTYKADYSKCKKESK